MNLDNLFVFERNLTTATTNHVMLRLGVGRMEQLAGVVCPL